MRNKVHTSKMPDIEGLNADHDRRYYVRNRPVRLLGGAEVWDDLRVPVFTTQAGGANPPRFGQYKDDGVTGSGFALEFDKSNDEGTEIPSNAGLTFDVNGTGVDKPFTIAFLIKLPVGYGTGHILCKTSSNYWRVDSRTNGRIRFRTSSGISVTTPNGVLTEGVVHAVVITVNALNATGTDVSIYVDSQLQASDSDSSKLQDANGSVFIGSRNGTASHADFTMDELRICTGVWSAANIASYYNGGQFTDGAVSNELVGYNFDEGAGNTAADDLGSLSQDITITNPVGSNTPAWVAGFISGGSRGVYLYWFDPDINQELFFTAQFPHSYKLRSNIVGHVHWVPSATGGANELVRWGIEYIWADINGTYGNTTTVYGDTPIGGETTMLIDTHYMTNATTIDGSNIQGVSSMLVGRVFRDALNDTYPHEAGKLELDFHFPLDSIGSRMINVK